MRQKAVADAMPRQKANPATRYPAAQNLGRRIAVWSRDRNGSSLLDARHLIKSAATDDGDGGFCDIDSGTHRDQ
jgi:hypothetical protein